MAKIDSFNYQYSLLLRSAEERLLGGFVSVYDLVKTRTLAQSALRVDGRVAFVDVYAYAPRVAELEDQQPLQRVSLDDAEAER